MLTSLVKIELCGRSCQARAAASRAGKNEVGDADGR